MRLPLTSKNFFEANGLLLSLIAVAPLLNCFALLPDDFSGVSQAKICQPEMSSRVGRIQSSFN
jgi:hypothetical protein